MERELLRILVIDDEPDMLWAIENILQPVGYAVTTTARGAEALNCWPGRRMRSPCGCHRRHGRPELATLIRQRSPQTAIVLISGYFYEEDRVITEGLQKDLFVGFVAKPFNLEEIRLMARKALERAGILSALAS